MSEDHSGEVPTDPRKCMDCGHIYGILIKRCPECDSENTRFVDEASEKVSDGFGNILEE